MACRCVPRPRSRVAHPPAADGRIRACPRRSTPGSPRDVPPGSAPTAAAAAAQLGVPVGAIANSLVFDVDGSPLLVLTSGAHRVDEARVAELLGVPRIARATPAFVREHTG